MPLTYVLSAVRLIFSSFWRDVPAHFGLCSRSSMKCRESSALTLLTSWIPPMELVKRFSKSLTWFAVLRLFPLALAASSYCSIRFSIPIFLEASGDKAPILCTKSTSIRCKPCYPKLLSPSGRLDFGCFTTIWGTMTCGLTVARTSFSTASSSLSFIT